MEQVKIATSRLFVTSAVENKDDFDEVYSWKCYYSQLVVPCSAIVNLSCSICHLWRCSASAKYDFNISVCLFQKLERSYNYLNNLINGLSDKEAHDALNNAVCKEKNYEDVSLGLLVVILSEPVNAAKSYRDLTLITRDGFGLVLNHLTQLILERYLRLNDLARGQLLWLVREMIRNAVTNVDNLCWNLMRHAAGGDVSPRNINLIESLLDMFIEYKSWLEKFPVLVASVVYTYLRLIEDHGSPALANLRQKEISFMVTLLKERFADCLVIGRDLVRLLQNVARISEFEQLWRDILTSPKTLCPSFSGILQLLQTRTSRRFLQSRLTPEMERKLVFLTSQVRFGNHKRYQDWFQRQYLATPESQTLRCDMIRFIVGVIHPTNELLCSDIIPRWAVIGWLLTTCTSNVAVSNAKLALFYDWLFFEPDKDNIMNIEPAILVMHHSMRSHPAVSATLLDFLCRIIPNFYPLLTDKVRSGIYSSLRQILEKRVLPTLCPLFDNPKLDRELRNMVRDTFKEFCLAPDSSKIEENVKNEELEHSEPHINNLIANNHTVIDEPAFSDEEDEPALVISTPEDDTDDDDIPLSKVRLKEKTQLDKGDTSEALNILEGELKNHVMKLQTETDNEIRCQAMESIVQHVIDVDLESEILTALSTCLCNMFFGRLDEIQRIFPEEVNDETLLDSIGSPLFVMFRNLYQLCKEEDRRRQPLITLLAEMYQLLPKIGYLLLYFLKVWGREELKREGESPRCVTLRGSVYKEFCQGAEKKVDACLNDDLFECRLDEDKILIWITPDVFKEFKQQTINNTQLLRVIVSTVNSTQLHDLVCEVMQSKLIMLKSENFQSVLKASLEWDTFEQFFLWQLIFAHDINIDLLLPFLPQLTFPEHSEALTNMLLIVKQERPTMDLLKILFSREVIEGDNFVISVIKYWCQEYMDKLGDIISSLLSTRNPGTSPNKRKRPGTKTQTTTTTAQPSSEQVLKHLEQLRKCNQCSGLYILDSMQKALQHAHNNSTEAQKKQYNELFALAEEEEIQMSRPRTGRAGRKPGPTKAPVKKTTVRDVSDSSEESSEVIITFF